MPLPGLGPGSGLRAAGQPPDGAGMSLLTAMEPTASPVTAERLARVRAAAECVTYCEDVPSGDRRTYRISIYGIYTTGEIFVQVTDCHAARTCSFFSRHKSCPPEIRRKGLPLVDVADAFALARSLARQRRAGSRSPSA